MQKKVIVFDFDGVILNSEELTASSLAAQFVGFTYEMQKELLRGNFHEGLKKLTLPGKPETDAEKEARKADYAHKKMHTPLYDGVADMLTALKKAGYVLALNTSARERNCVPTLEHAGLATLFDFLGTAEVSLSKVEKFTIILDKYNVSPKEMIFVTDTLGDLREAEIAGVPTIAVTYGAHDRSYFIKENHANLVGVVDSVAELSRKLLA